MHTVQHSLPIGSWELVHICVGGRCASALGRQAQLPRLPLHVTVGGQYESRKEPGLCAF